MEIREAIERIKDHKQIHFSNEPRAIKITEALDMAIEALEKQIPKTVVIHAWSPAKCPTCGTELSESLNDGYYKHLKQLKVCQNSECCQRLIW